MKIIHFYRPLLNGTGDESLVVEVWDFDPAETLGEKMTKFLDIKGVRGFRKLMKEIAVTASTGKHDNELIGRCSIPLRVGIFLLRINQFDMLGFEIIFYLNYYISTDNFNFGIGDVVQFG